MLYFSYEQTRFVQLFIFPTYSVTPTNTAPITTIRPTQNPSPGAAQPTVLFITQSIRIRILPGLWLSKKNYYTKPEVGIAQKKKQFYISQIYRIKHKMYNLNELFMSLLTKTYKFYMEYEEREET
jgi:hypothetical protein